MGTLALLGEALPNFCGKIATIIIAGSFTILDWLESHFSCRKSESRLISNSPLTIYVYCFRTTPRHVTNIVYGNVY